MSRRQDLPPGFRRLTMDPWDGDAPAVGHYLATPKGRRAYRVHACGPRPKAPGLALVVEVMPRHSLPDDAHVHFFQWSRS